MYLWSCTVNFIEKERDRGREKYYRLNYKNKKNTENKRKTIKSYTDKYPEKVIAKNKCSHLKASIKGNHLHHWSYNLEHAKDVIELSRKDHYKAHRFIIYDQERMMYRRCDTMELLDTKELHIEFIEYCVRNKPD